MNEVTVLGEALWDVYPTRASASIRARRREQRVLGGAPANVAVTLARLGVRVGMITTVGEDALGQGLRDELADAGVDVSCVHSVRARTGVTWVELGDTPRYVPFRATKGQPGAEMIPAALESPWLHVSSSSFTDDASAEAVRLALSRSNARLSFDLNIYPHLWSSAILPVLREPIALAHVVKASEPDLAALGLDERGLCALRPGRLTIVTRGERGAVAYDGQEAIEHRVRRVRTIDPIGAGDAFMAGLLASLVRGKDVHSCLALAARLGARAVTALGATTALRDLGRERRALARVPTLR